MVSCWSGRHLGAALLVVEGNGARHLLCNNSGRVRSADAGRQNQHLIADAHTPIRAAITIKFHMFPSLSDFLFQIFPVSLHIVDMDVFSDPNVLGGNADMLTVLDHRFSLGDIPDGDFMIDDNVLRRGEADILAIRQHR